MVAGILIDLDVGCVDHLELVTVLGLGDCCEQGGEDPAVRPAIVKPIDAVPPTEALRLLVPDAPRNENPPDAVHCFWKTGGASAFFENVRSVRSGVKLNF